MTDEFKKKKFRWNLLIYPKFQLTLVFLVLVVFVTTLGCITFEFWQTFENLNNVGLQSNLGQNHVYFEFLRAQRVTLFKIIAYVGGVGLLLSLLVSLYVTHRLAGPLVRLKSHFERMGNTGEFREIHFRENDFFEELPEIINVALARLLSSQKK